MAEQMKTCPFCENGHTTVAILPSKAKTVVCLECCADGPAAATEAEAVALWNAAPRADEARTCVKCVHWAAPQGVKWSDCSEPLRHGMMDFNGMMHADFGCNLWEPRKENANA